MNKNEILEKSRKDNGPVDERFLFMQQRTGYIMTSVMLVVWAILFIWDAICGGDSSMGGAIVMSGIATMCWCQFYQLRTKSSLVFGAFAVLGAVSFAVQHIMLSL